jgi:hypothetical protein
MIKNKKVVFGILVLFGILLFANFISAEGTFCCEKTTSGAFCQNAPKEQCDVAFKSSPTSCDSTSYCKPGCCFDSQEGICAKSTPQRVCADSNGTWADKADCNIAQCNLGCCVLGDQGAFVTLARCRSLSGYYGIKTDFRKNIADEVTCIQTAQGADKGACVFEDPATLQKTCVFMTREKCKTSSLSITENITSLNASSAASGFYKDILCSAEELGTNCAPSTKTTLIDGKDEVYFQDTCGNPANIYDANRYTDKQYWKKVFTKTESCGAGTSNANSRTCGNCDYYYGSIGKRANTSTVKPTYGNNICVDLSCKSLNKKHGESWCATDSPVGDGKDTPGSRYFKNVCIFNEIINEPCADYRNEVCIQDTFGTFSEAACRVNKWQDCLGQKSNTSCQNSDIRDCMWFPNYYYSSTDNQIKRSCSYANYIAGNCGAQTVEGVCLPKFPPGSKFWESTAASSVSTAGSASVNSTSTSTFGTGYVAAKSSASASLCTTGNTKVTVKFTKIKRPADWLKLFGSEDWKCANDSSECGIYATNPALGNLKTEDAAKWATDMNAICTKLGDCGGEANWVGKTTTDGYAGYLNSNRIAGSGGASVLEATTTTSTSTAATTTGTTSASSTSSQVSNAASGLSSLSSAASAFG